MWRLIRSHTIDAIDSNQVIVDRVHHAVPADAQPVVSAPVERLCRIRATGQGSDRSAYSAHPDLVVHVPAG